MKITKYVKGGYDYVHNEPSPYDKMRENGWSEYGDGSLSYNFDPDVKQFLAELERTKGPEWYDRFSKAAWHKMGKADPYYLTYDQAKRLAESIEGSEDFVIDYKIPDDPEYIARQERKRMAMEKADEDDYYDRLHGEGEYEGNPHDIYADEELPFGDDPDGPYDPYDEEFEKDRQRDQELLDQYGGAIRIWYAENQLNGKEGSYICPGSDVEQAVREAVNQTASKDPNRFVITQVDVLEGYYDPESGMTPYDGEPVWRSGDTKQSRDMWYEADKALENMCLDTKEGWIKQQAAEYGTNLEAKETIKDIGLSEGRFKNDHEFDVLWNFAINYDDEDDIESATAVTSGTPGWIQNHVQDRKQANEFLSRFDDDFIQDLRSNWQDYIHEMSEYYSLEDDDPRKESGAPNANEWLAGLAESYPDIPMEELDDAWKCIEALDDDYLAYI